MLEQRGSHGRSEQPVGGSTLHRETLDYPSEVTHRVLMKLVALSAVLVSACLWAGVAEAAPTRSEFIRKGDVACAQTKRELAPVVSRAEEAKLLPRSQQWGAAASLWADQIRIQKRFVVRTDRTIAWQYVDNTVPDRPPLDVVRNEIERVR